MHTTDDFGQGYAEVSASAWETPLFNAIGSPGCIYW